MQNGQYQMELVRRLAFPRPAGSENEEKAARILLDEIKSAGGRGELMKFPIPAAEFDDYSVTAGGKSLECAPYGFSGCIDAELKLLFAGDGKEATDYKGVDDLSGYAVLINDWDSGAYKLLCERGASAFLTVSGKWYGSETDDLLAWPLRPADIRCGRVPGLAIRAYDATELVRDKVETVHVTLRQREVTGTSRNVLAVVPGTDLARESIAVTAHFDSEAVGTGSADNASGTANIMALYRYFLKKPTRRTLRFIWCGAEEDGLMGSKAYVRERGCGDVKLCVNYDMCGTALGFNGMDVAGTEELFTFAKDYCEKTGWTSTVEAYADGSDSAPFANLNIPCICPYRFSYTAKTHSRYDTMFPLSMDAFADMEEFSIGLIENVANGDALPAPLGMTEALRKDLDEMFDE